MKIFVGKEASDFLGKYNLNTVSLETSKNFEEAAKKAYGNSFPLVFKIHSKEADKQISKVAHRKEEMEKALSEITETAKKQNLKYEEIVFHELVEGLNLKAGLKKDPVFGHVIMLGFEGVEGIVQDRVYRACPLNDREAGEIINELIVRDLVFSSKVDIERLKKFLMRLSKLPQKKRDISELSINSLILNEKGPVISDAKIVFE